MSSFKKFVLPLLVLALTSAALPAFAQDNQTSNAPSAQSGNAPVAQTGNAPAPQTGNTPADQNGNPAASQTGNAQAQQGAPQGEAGGPAGGTGPIIIPKKQPEPPTAPPPKPKPEPNPEYSFSVNVPIVQVPVIVQTKDGNFIPHLTKDNFRVFEDGVAQNLNGVKYSADAPMTAVMLVEFRNQWYPLLYQILEASYYFTNQLQPKDWVALMIYDMKPQVLVDFTHDKRAIYAGLRQLYYPGFSESNLYDALADTISRLEGIPGRKVIVLITTGQDTFSKLTFDKTRKILEATQDISIFPVQIGWAIQEYAETHGLSGYATMGHMDFLQAENQLKYFAKVTGGRYYEPRFESAFNDAFNDIANAVRNQYILSYKPTNTKLDGSYRKLKIDVVGNDGQPLKVVNQKGKPVKYEIVAKNGYWSKHQVE